MASHSLHTPPPSPYASRPSTSSEFRAANLPYELLKGESLLLHLIFWIKEKEGANVAYFDSPLLDSRRKEEEWNQADCLLYSNIEVVSLEHTQSISISQPMCAHVLF